MEEKLQEFLKGLKVSNKVLTQRHDYLKGRSYSSVDNRFKEIKQKHGIGDCVVIYFTKEQLLSPEFKECIEKGIFVPKNGTKLVACCSDGDMFFDKSEAMHLIENNEALEKAGGVMMFEETIKSGVAAINMKELIAKKSMGASDAEAKEAATSAVSDSLAEKMDLVYYDFEEVMKANKKLTGWAEKVERISEENNLSPYEKYLLCCKIIDKMVIETKDESDGKYDPRQSYIETVRTNEGCCVGKAQYLRALLSMVGIEACVAPVNNKREACLVSTGQHNVEELLANEFEQSGYKEALSGVLPNIEEMDEVKRYKATIEEAQKKVDEINDGISKLDDAIAEGNRLVDKADKNIAKIDEGIATADSAINTVNTLENLLGGNLPQEIRSTVEKLKKDREEELALREEELALREDAIAVRDKAKANREELIAKRDQGLALIKTAQAGYETLVKTTNEKYQKMALSGLTPEIIEGFRKNQLSKIEDEEKSEPGVRHAINMVYLNDPKYGIQGVFAADLTAGKECGCIPLEGGVSTLFSAASIYAGGDEINNFLSGLPKDSSQTEINQEDFSTLEKNLDDFGKQFGQVSYQLLGVNYNDFNEEKQARAKEAVASLKQTRLVDESQIGNIAQAQNKIDKIYISSLETGTMVKEDNLVQQEGDQMNIITTEGQSVKAADSIANTVIGTSNNKRTQVEDMYQHNAKIWEKMNNWTKKDIHK